MNKVMLIGRCTGAVLSKTIETTGSAVVNFTVVTNRKYKNAAGMVVNEPEYNRCTAYGVTAEILTKYLSKGKKMFVEGRLKTRKRTTAEGVEKQATEIVIENFIFLGDRPTESDGHEAVSLDNSTNTIDEVIPSPVVEHTNIPEELSL